GLRGERLSAMQGPFSAEMNAAMLRQTGARWLVTKESGGRGGFADKIRAAGDCGVGVVVIRRPLKEEGISVEEAMRRMEALAPEDRRKTEGSGRSVCLIGIGMGGGAHLTREALEALAGCDALFGAPRMLEAVKEFAGHVPMEPLYQAGKILDWLTRHPACKNAVAVCSGDTGFYSGGEPLAALLKQNGFEVRICPGISSAAALAARLGCGWEDWHLDSMHGRDSDPAKLLERYEKVFLLLGGEHGIRDVCRRLVSGGWQSARVTVGIRLGYPGEQVNAGTAGQYARYAGDDGLSCMLIERTGTKSGEIKGQEG
ncbi:MAG: precorrin-6y C5,15-methyltransferase (decarboxylating) subunit CbiE, partial [Clostridiales bacterium]|nr:precorrin-6y C5,15-methyltransferase (decarboxylating) subunit CbiE [Clostridiales bacterium]